MNWLAEMNKIIQYIEDNLTENITYEKLSSIVGCSVYEFSRIFSFMTKMSISEYIRRRRLSQAVFDIQNCTEKIVDIALKYCYESQATFTRAFRELHGTAPLSARKSGVPLKTYPPLTFSLTIKGGTELNFRIEKKTGISIVGMPVLMSIDEDNTMPSLWNSSWILDESRLKAGLDTGQKPRTDVEEKIIDVGDTKTQIGLRIQGEKIPESFTKYLIAAIDYEARQDKVNAVIGFECSEQSKVAGGAFTVPALTWVIFSFDEERNSENVAEAYGRIFTEWFPVSQYRRNKAAPHLERFCYEQNARQPWEIWIPII